MRRLMVMGLSLTLGSAAFAAKPGMSNMAMSNTALPTGTTQHVMLSPADVQWGPNPNSLPPGAQTAVLSGDPSKPGLFTMRLKAPAGYKVPAHWHSNAELITVLSGTFYMGMGDKLDPAMSKPYSTDSYLVMPARSHHFAWTKDGAVIQVTAQGPFDITYINPTDDPRGSQPKM